jgi:hypothetical protein
MAHDYEIRSADFDTYLSRAHTAVAVDMGQLRARLKELVTDEPLRRRMGAAGQARARSTFDWSLVFPSYQALWDEQTAIRRRAAADPATRDWLSEAPKTGAEHMGPFDTFASYPTRHVSAATWVSPAPGVTPQAYRELILHKLLAYAAVTPKIVDPVLAALEQGPATVGDLAQAIGIPPDQMIEVAARLAKIDFLVLVEPTGG